MTKLIDRPPFPPVPEKDPFRHGWRFVHRRSPEGTEECVQVPLTMEDVLHPQEGDCIPENTLHNYERGYLYDVFCARVAHRPLVRVFSDCIIKWGVEGIRNHSPDVSVFDNVPDQERRWGIFPAREQGARPLAAVEIVSPDDSDHEARDNDVVEKRGHYQVIGIPWYLIVDQEREHGPRRLVLLKNTPAGWVEIPPRPDGRVLLEPVNVLIGLEDNRLVCYDPATGEEIGNFTAQTLARQAAEEKVGLEAEARKAAEDKARAESEARKLAEEKLRTLEAELQRLRSQTADPGPST